MSELRVADSQVRSVATGLDSAAAALETMATTPPRMPFTGAATVSQAISNASALHAARALIAAQGGRAAAEAASTSLNELDAAERALVAALA